jgi:hypothetical protein
MDAVLAGAVGTTIVDAIGLHSVADNTAATMGAGGGQGVDGALETVEHMGLAVAPDLEALVIPVAAHLARRQVGFSGS